MYNSDNMQQKHETWLIASNLSTYNIMGAFSKNSTITWGLTVRANIGDVIFIYVSAPYSRIKYKCIVDSIDVTVSERLGAEFWIAKFNPNRYLINLRLISILDDDRLRLKYLTENKLMSSAPQGPRRVSNTLNDFLDSL